MEKKTGVQLIAEERQEQIEKHGRTIESDCEMNDRGELRKAANALLNYTNEGSDIYAMPFNWDTDTCEKMCAKSYKERLIISGALIAAEVDRIQNTE